MHYLTAYSTVVVCRSHSDGGDSNGRKAERRQNCGSVRSKGTASYLLRLLLRFHVAGSCTHYFWRTVRRRLCELPISSADDDRRCRRDDRSPKRIDRQRKSPPQEVEQWRGPKQVLVPLAEAELHQRPPLAAQEALVNHSSRVARLALVTFLHMSIRKRST